MTNNKEIDIKMINPRSNDIIIINSNNGAHDRVAMYPLSKYDRVSSL